MARGILRAAIYLASAVLIFFGFVFVVSVNLGLDYFLVGLALFAVAGFLLFLGQEKKPIEIKQTVTVTGPLETKEIRCPNCGALIDATTTEVVDGKPFVTCRYCGNKFELTEEPTW
jgi:DNA-directed RNA polymerase subunit RPC12/RpoP